MRKSNTRVLARILKMPVQNRNSKISTHRDLSTQLLQILIPTTFDSQATFFRKKEGCAYFGSVCLIGGKR